MIDLRRLADSPLLLNGFEDFVAKWCGGEPEELPDDTDLKTWFAISPPEVRQYWEIANRWPKASLLGAEFSLSMQIFDGNPVIVDGGEGWTIYWDRSIELLRVVEKKNPIKNSIGEFLVTYGLFEMVMGNDFDFTDETGNEFGVAEVVVPESTEIWEGELIAYAPSLLRFYFHPKGILWWDDDSHWRFYAGQSQEADDWLTELMG